MGVAERYYRQKLRIHTNQYEIKCM